MSLSDFDRVLDSMYGGQPSYTGKLVSQTGSLALSTVWSCINVLSGDIATLPFLTYQYVENGKKPARNHYLWSLLQEEANPELTAWRFKQMMQVWLSLWGNAYAEIQISNRGQVSALWPWRPDRVKVERRGGPGGPLQYSYKLKDGRAYGPIPEDRMLHLRGMGTDGVMGLSPIEIHRQTVGIGMAVTETTGRLWGQGARPLGVLTHPGKLSAKAEQSLKDGWADRHMGLANSHRVAILEEGMTYLEVGLKPVDAQYIQTAELTDKEICRIYNVPQHRAGVGDPPNNNVVEQRALEYIQFTLNPLATNWHQEIERSLLSARERQQICVRPNFRSLLRGDHAAMSKFLTDLWGRGIINADEAREEFLDMNPQPDGLGRVFYVPSNMMDASQVGDNFGDQNQGQQVKPLNPPPKKKPPVKDPKAEDFTNGVAH